MNIYFLGKYDGKEDEDVVIKLEKTPFTEETIDKLLSSKTSLKLSFQNDIYRQFDGFTDPELNQLKAVVIHPAAQRHIIKYTSQDRYMIHETPGDYEKITLPYVRDQQPSLQVIYYFLLRGEPKRLAV